MSRVKSSSTGSRLRAVGCYFGVATAVSILLAPTSFATDAADLGQSSTSAATTTAASTALAKSTATSTGAATAPQLRISVDNGRTSATVGDSVNYVLTIQNLGSADAPGLQITQSVPVGLKFKSADAGGIVSAGNVRWTMDLTAAKTAVFHTAMTVSATPKDLLRLATVACASLSVKAPPLVCASHSDQLPAGAAAAAIAPASTPTTHTWWWYVGGGIVLVLLLGVVMALLARRRSASATIESRAIRTPQ